MTTSNETAYVNCLALLTLLYSSHCAQPKQCPVTSFGT